MIIEEHVILGNVIQIKNEAKINVHVNVKNH